MRDRRPALSEGGPCPGRPIVPSAPPAARSLRSLPLAALRCGTRRPRTDGAYQGRGEPARTDPRRHHEYEPAPQSRRPGRRRCALPTAGERSRQGSPSVTKIARMRSARSPTSCIGSTSGRQPIPSPCLRWHCITSSSSERAPTDGSASRQSASKTARGSPRTRTTDPTERDRRVAEVATLGHENLRLTYEGDGAERDELRFDDLVWRKVEQARRD